MAAPGCTTMSGRLGAKARTRRIAFFKVHSAVVLPWTVEIPKSTTFSSCDASKIATASSCPFITGFNIRWMVNMRGAYGVAIKPDWRAYISHYHPHLFRDKCNQTNLIFSPCGDELVNSAFGANICSRNISRRVALVSVDVTSWRPQRHRSINGREGRVLLVADFLQVILKFPRSDQQTMMTHSLESTP